MVDLLQSAKNILGGKSPFAAPAVPEDNRIDVIGQCSVIWYQWKYELATETNAVFGALSATKAPRAPAKLLAESRAYDISNHVSSWSYSKGMDAGAGVFQLTLENSFDWAKYMRPGQWICVYLANDGTLNLPEEPRQTAKKSIAESVQSLAGLGGLRLTPELNLPKANILPTWAPKRRCVGIIQRVGIRSQTSVDGAVTVSYTITGKDFGAIYEDTELWFNANNASLATFQRTVQSWSRNFARNLTDLLTVYHKAFLSPDDAWAASLSSLREYFPRQWVLPDQMVKDLNLPMNGEGYFGDIQNLTEFYSTAFENPMANPLSALQGRCWNKLKSLSQPEYHELFTELSDAGQPKIIFRPIPWAMDKSRYPTVGKLIMSYKDLAKEDDVPPPLPPGTNFSSFPDVGKLADALKSAASLKSGDFRTRHSFKITAAEVESFDVGPDYHNRCNFFLVDSKTAMKDQVNAWALLGKSPFPPFPFRDENDIQRHGFKPLFVDIHTFQITTSHLFGNEPSKTFMLEVNEVLRDYHANAEDFYSGSIILAAGRNDVKLGKVLLTDNTFEGISNMVFYVEAYIDNFVVNPDKTCIWTQTLSVTRGIERDALEKGFGTKERQSTDPETFHVDAPTKTQQTALDKVKSAIKDPPSFLK